MDASEDTLIDRLHAQLALFREAETAYEKNTGDKVSHWQRRMIARYTRNLAMINSELVAGLFDLTVAARSIVDDNYAWEVWETANRYPSQKANSDLQTVNLSGEEVWLDTRRLRLRRRLPRPKQRLRPSSLKARKKEKEPGEWARQLDGDSDLLLPAGGPHDRRLRTLSQAESQEHALGGADASGTFPHVDSGWHRPA